MSFKGVLVIALLSAVLNGQMVEGPGISVKDKTAVESEVAKLTAKLAQLQTYWSRYINHRDQIREGFLHDSIFKLKGLAQDQIDLAFEKFDVFQVYLERLKESIFVADPEHKEKWTQMLDNAANLTRIYPELNVLKNQTLNGKWEKGTEKVLMDRKRFLFEQLERIKALAKDLRNLKKTNEKRIERYRHMLEQLKEWSQAIPGTWEGSFNQPMPKSKLMWVIVETKKEIVILKRSILSIIKFATDEELRKDILCLEEVRYVF